MGSINCDPTTTLMKFFRFHRSFLALSTVFIVASLARGQVIYNNLGSTTQFVPGPGYILGPFENAVRFTAGTTLLLDYADLAVWSGTPGTTANVAVLQNTNANTPGAVLEMTIA